MFLEFGQCKQTKRESIPKETIRILDKTILNISSESFNAKTNKSYLWRSCLHTLLWPQFKLSGCFRIQITIADDMSDIDFVEISFPGIIFVL